MHSEGAVFPARCRCSQAIQWKASVYEPRRSKLKTTSGRVKEKNACGCPRIHDNQRGNKVAALSRKDLDIEREKEIAKKQMHHSIHQ